jgi:broad specificity phosphatase PhoE
MTTAAPRFLLQRHGQSTANVLGLIASGPDVAEVAYGITETGRSQVRDQVRIALEGGVLVPGARIVSSPLLRARESAMVAAELLDSSVEIDTALRERGFGSLDLGPDSEYEKVWVADACDPGHVRWGVESVRAILLRTASLLARVVEEGEPGPVLLCTHGDVASILLCAASGTRLGLHRDVGSMQNGEIRPLAHDAILLADDARS